MVLGDWIRGILIVVGVAVVVEGGEGVVVAVGQGEGYSER